MVVMANIIIREPQNGTKSFIRLLLTTQQPNDAHLMIVVILQFFRHFLTDQNMHPPAGIMNIYYLPKCNDVLYCQKSMQGDERSKYKIKIYSR